MCEFIALGLFVLLSYFHAIWNFGSTSTISTEEQSGGIIMVREDFPQGEIQNDKEKTWICKNTKKNFLNHLIY